MGKLKGEIRQTGATILGKNFNLNKFNTVSLRSIQIDRFRFRLSTFSFLFTIQTILVFPMISLRVAGVASLRTQSYFTQKPEIRLCSQANV